MHVIKYGNHHQSEMDGGEEGCTDTQYISPTLGGNTSHGENNTTSPLSSTLSKSYLFWPFLTTFPRPLWKKVKEGCEGELMSSEKTTAVLSEDPTLEGDKKRNYPATRWHFIFWSVQAGEQTPSVTGGFTRVWRRETGAASFLLLSHLTIPCASCRKWFNINIFIVQ